MAVPRKFNPAAVAFLAASIFTCSAICLASDPSPAARCAFQPITNAPTPPNIENPADPIDAFILAKLKSAGLSPAALADRITLVRRAYFDLLGLPPSPAQVDAFVKDDRPDAFARLVDRLLESPQYGERWARHWLDVVRYADTSGFENDLLYEGAWKYRDYVIRAFNADKPFNRFAQEQVAGDEFWPDDPDALIATGMYVVGPALPESASMSGQLDYDWLTDAADTTGAAFLGLTMGCSRCHDHKYDPLTQKDYFSLQAVFAASDRPYPSKFRDNEIKRLNDLVADNPVPKQYEDDPRAVIQTEKMAGFRLFHRAHPLEVHRLQRGEIGKPREVTGPAIPAVFAREAPDDFANVAADQRRATFAKWLTSPSNPFTARVIVNRMWGWHFGQAIVRTPNDFGAQGEPPTHPELLDWLASDFMSHGWSIKRLHRQIMLSSAYQMSSIASGQAMQIDPQDKLLWHYPRHRLEGEAIRDAMLACAGTLNFKQFGRAVVPPLSAGELTGLFDAKDKWQVSKDPAEFTRRSVYVLVRRTFIYPLFAAFDPPEVMNSCPRRMQTIVPTQALALLNGPVSQEQATAFAKRLTSECGDDHDKQIENAWLLAFSRSVSEPARQRAKKFLADRKEAGKGETALADLCLAIFNADEFVYVD